jgi:hypothetical protein
MGAYDLLWQCDAACPEPKARIEHENIDYEDN